MSGGLLMSDGAFLEKARQSSGPDYWDWLAALDKEILAVVERMEFEHADHSEEIKAEGTEAIPCRGCQVLKALDEKAGGCE